MRGTTFAAIAAASILAGCASGYSKFYRPIDQSGATAANVAYTGEPEIIASSGDPDQDAAYMWSEGFAPVGYSSFVGPMESGDAAIKQGKAVGARYVVVASRYASTVSGAIPVTTPTSSTAYTSGNVSAYGSGGTAQATFSGTTTTYGTQTNYIPYQVERHNQQAIYFSPIERKGLGTYGTLVSPEQAAQIGTNKGYWVAAVRRGSPAFNADILPGDVVMDIGGSAITDAVSYRAAIQRAYGGSTKISILRNGRMLSLSLALPEDGYW